LDGFDPDGFAVSMQSKYFSSGYDEATVFRERREILV
jgi:hypothetical protein